MNSQRALKMDNELSIANHSCGDCKTSVEKNLQIPCEDKSVEFCIRNEKSNKSRLQYNSDKYENKYFVSVLDEEGKLRIAEVKKSHKFSVNEPIGTNKKRISASDKKKKSEESKKNLNTIRPLNAALPNKKLKLGCSNQTIDSQSSTANICELVDGLSNYSDYEDDDFEQEIATTTNSDTEHERETNTTKQVSVKYLIKHEFDS